MNDRKNNKIVGLDFNVENIALLLWKKKWIIVIVTSLFVGMGVILFKVSKKPQFYKYTTGLSLQYQVGSNGTGDAWIACERIPWKMAKVDYAKALYDSVFKEKFVSSGGVSGSNDFLLSDVVVDSYDSLHIVLSLVVAGENEIAEKYLLMINELLPGYVVDLQKNKLVLQICLLEKRKEQVISELTGKGQRLQDLSNTRNIAIVDRMETLRLENECQILYNSSLDLMAQISTLQVFLNDEDLLVLKPDSEIRKELLPGGLFSHLSMFVLLFAFLGFMVITNLIILKAYIIDNQK